MIVSQFQAWAETASEPSRADGVSALARALLYSNLDADQSQAAVVALAGYLDDPSPLVRRALADAFASAIDAPRAIVLALAEDEPSIASIVLSRSPVLGDAELIDCAAAVDDTAQAAIASRPYLSAVVAAALAEVGSARALLALAENLDADLPEFAMMRMIERHGDRAELRSALLARGNLPIEIRFELVAITARELAVFVAGRGWTARGRIERAAREATEKAAIAIAAATDESGEWPPSETDLAALAAHLRDAGRVTPALALRALLSGNREFFNAMLSDLSGTAVSRVKGLTRAYDSMGFAALYRKSGLPAALLPAFRIALGALKDWDSRACDCLYLPLVIYVHDQCALASGGAFDKLLVLLRRFEAEASRDEARTRRSAVVAAQEAFAAQEPFMVHEAVVVNETVVVQEAVIPDDSLAQEPAIVSEETFPFADFRDPGAPCLVEETGPAQEAGRAEEAGLAAGLTLVPEPHLVDVAFLAGAPGVEGDALAATGRLDSEDSRDAATSEIVSIAFGQTSNETASRVDHEDPDLTERPYWFKAARHAADARHQDWSKSKRKAQWVNVEADLAQFEAELFAA